MSTLEDQVTQEQAAYEAQDETTVEPPDEDEDNEPDEAKPGEQTTAFEPADYDREDLQIPKVDGQGIDRISLKFSGEVFLDRSEPSDVAVYNALRLGRDVRLLIEAKCSKTGASGATDRDGNLDVVVGTKGLKVHSLQRPAGADWVEEV